MGYAENIKADREDPLFQVYISKLVNSSPIQHTLLSLVGHLFHFSHKHGALYFFWAVYILCLIEGELYGQKSQILSQL